MDHSRRNFIKKPLLQERSTLKMYSNISIVEGNEGVLCMEHGMHDRTKEGEALVIQAYRECDSFILG